MSSKRLDRRTFIVASGALLLGDCGRLRSTELLSDLEIPYEWLGQMLAPYFRDHPGENNSADLGALLGGGLGASPDEVMSHWRRPIAEDFATGEVVKLDGWTLSRTEVRLWAWLYLTRHSKAKVI